MGACGCINIQYRNKVKLADGNYMLIGIYPGCDYCCSPAGVDFARVSQEDIDNWHYDIPDMEFWEHSNMYSIPVVATKFLREAMQGILVGAKPDDGETFDQIDAEILSEEAFSDPRDVVFKTLEHWKSGNL